MITAVAMHGLPRGKEPWPIEVAVVASHAPSAVTLHIRQGKEFAQVSMTAAKAFAYRATIPAALLKPGFLDYFVTIESGSDRLVIPDSHGSWPDNWDFPKSGGYRVPVVAVDAPLTLFDAARDDERVIVPYGGYSNVTGFGIVPSAEGDPVVRLDAAAVAQAVEQDLPVQLAWNGALVTEGRALDQFVAMRVEGRAKSGSECVVGVMLIKRDGTAWGAPVRLRSDGLPVRVPLTALRPVKAAMLPRDFPKGINSYWLRMPAGRGGSADRLRLANLQAVQFTLSTRFSGSAADPAVKVEIARIALTV